MYMTRTQLWVAEYQEQDALLISPQNLGSFSRVCSRERAPFAVVGTVTGDGRVVVHDSWDGSSPVDLDLDSVLGKMPNKVRFVYIRRY